jgi:hypothetical protein
MNEKSVPIARIAEATPKTKRKIDALIEKALVEEPSPTSRSKANTVTGTLIKKMDFDNLLSKVSTSEVTRYTADNKVC